jgi:uncharacterized protein
VSTVKITNGFLVKRVKGRGFGLFTGHSFTSGELIIEYVGKKIPTTLADTLTTRYLFDLENGFTIDGAIRTNTARYINHSCHPNAETELDPEEGRKRGYSRRS